MRTFKEIQLSDEQVNQFWKLVDVKNQNECWEWQGTRWTGEYGHYLGYVTSRVVWVILYGEIPQGMFICHKCDNPPCCNPNHLFCGTSKDNMQDAVRKGRRTWKPDRFNWKYCWRSGIVDHQ
jgi:hypothetical protein